MNRHARTALLALTFSLCALALATTASAQSNGGSDAERPTLLQQGEFELGADIALLWSVDSSKPDDGDSVTHDSYYGDLGAHFGYMVQDNFETRLHAGWLRVAVNSEEETIQRTNAFLASFQLLFHAPVSNGLALYLGPGAGGYIGQTKRDVGIEGQTLTAENATNGLLGQLLTGVLIETGTSFVLRTGLRLDGLVGREIPAEGTDLPRRNTQNVKLVGVLEGSGTF